MSGATRSIRMIWPSAARHSFEQEGARINAMAKNINTLIKQLRRAQKMLESQ